MSFLRRNLDAIFYTSPELIKRILKPVQDDYIEKTNDGTFLKIGLSKIPITCSEEDCNKFKQKMEETEEVVLLGLGCGKLLETWQNTNGKKPNLIVWENDLNFLLQSLESVDLRQAIFSRALSFIYSIDLVKLSNQTSRYYHPHLKDLYAPIFDYCFNKTQDKRCVALWKGLMIQDVAETLKNRQWGVYPIFMHSTPSDEIFHIISATRPQVLFSINAYQGMTTLAKHGKVPWICWDIDPTTNLKLRLDNSGKQKIFTYRRANIERYKEETSSDQVHFLPFAANPLRRKPHFDQGYECNVSFVGASMQDTAPKRLRELLKLLKDSGQTQNMTQKQVTRIISTLIKEQLSNAGETILRDRVHQEFPLLEKWLITEPDPLDPVMLLGEQAASQHRARVLQNLRNKTPEVWGDEGWGQVHGITYRGAAGNNQMLNKIYSNSKINIDIGRVYQPEIVTLRVFDVLACGGFLLAPFNEELGRLFRIGEHLDVYHSQEDLNQKIDFYLKEPKLRQKIAAQGRKWVIHNHTIDQRVKTMFRTLTHTRQRVG